MYPQEDNQKKRAWAEIDASALRHNIAALQKRYSGNGSTRIMAVVKADAYGHGITLVAPICYTNGIRDFGVATLDEGILLRDMLPSEARIHLLSPMLPSDADRIVAGRLIALVSSLDLAEAVSKQAVLQQAAAEVHMEVDTGIGRSGASLGDAYDLYQTIQRLPALRLSGVSTHFASADEDELDARAQLALFQQFLKTLGSPGADLVLHTSNSPASLLFGSSSTYRMIRPGLLLYGIEPAPGMLGDQNEFLPVLSLKGRVTLCRPLSGGATISYGKTYTVPTGGGVYATIPVGYGDGWPRRLSNSGYVLLHGRRAPVCGRICMDQFVVDVTHIRETQVGDVATLVGQDGSERLTAGGIAAGISATPHEITTCLTSRLPRVLINS